ncbi:hypothetical protein ACIRF8_03250 [Streptomyces sp. NPDC102406]|uniref:hypothetical protein n=1 Tax=Streptomyces sp. NPDC102406 TaxID=3366171 RepID=UPI00382FCA11
MGVDPFANMSHEEMLAWIDEADPGTVQAGADRFLAAAKEIEKIAGELKTRPQYVEWKGQGADSFRTWSGDFANATLRVADYAAESGMYLSHAADAIARTKASVPRTDGGAQANIDAAKAAPHDPDSSSILAKATAQKEQVRQQTADEMTKLGQSYQQSAERITALKKPTIPPPPKAIVPDSQKQVDASEHVAVPGRTGSGSSPAAPAATPGHTASASAGAAPQTQQSTVPGHGGEVTAGRTPHVEPAASVPHTSIDSAATLPDTRTTGPSVTPTVQGPGTAGQSGPNVPVPPPTLGGTAGRTGPVSGTKLPSGPVPNEGQGRTYGTARPSGPGQGTARPRAGMPGLEEGRTATGGRAMPSDPYGRAPGGTTREISGGRPTQQQTGRTTPYRGTVVGSEPAGGTTAGGRTGAGTGRAVPGGTQAGGRALPTRRAGGRAGTSASEPVTGRPVAGRGQAGVPEGRSSAQSRGVMGAPPAQRNARTASGERAVPGKAPVSRDGIAGGTGSAQRDNKKRRKQDRRDQRPEFVTEDEETWLPDGRRIVPPTVD